MRRSPGDCSKPRRGRGEAERREPSYMARCWIANVKNDQWKIHRSLCIIWCVMLQYQTAPQLQKFSQMDSAHNFEWKCCAGFVDVIPGKAAVWKGQRLQQSRTQITRSEAEISKSAVIKRFIIPPPIIKPQKYSRGKQFLRFLTSERENGVASKIRAQLQMFNNKSYQLPLKQVWSHLCFLSLDNVES